ncbi:MAG: HEAT repeat domain-containing protein [Myxococcales bacterium]
MTATLAVLALALASPSWQAQVLSDDAAVRAPALAHLSAKGRPGLYAIQDLVARAPGAADRARAIRALGELGDADAEWALRAELRQTDPTVAAAAVRAAARLRLARLHGPVAARVGDPDPTVCDALGFAAGTFPEIVDAARAALAGTEPTAALAGLRILAAAGTAIPAADAQRLLGSPLPEASLLAAEVLAPTDAAAAEAVEAKLAAGPEPLGGRAALDLARLGSPDALAALEALARGSGTAERAVGALAATPRGLVSLLALRGRESELGPLIDRVFASRPPAIADLLAVVHAADDRTARAAVALLSGRPEGVAALDACLRQLGSDAERCALGLTAPSAAPVLKRALDSVDDRVRALAAWACASSDGKPMLEALAPLAVDPSASVRAAAALGLGRLGAEGTALLRTLVHDPSDRVRSAAAGQLAEILPDAELAELVRGTLDDAAVRPQLLPALARLPAGAAVTLLIESLRRGTPAERRQAVTQLARFNDPRAYEALMQVASRDPDTDARRLATQILGN